MRLKYNLHPGGDGSNGGSKEGSHSTVQRAKSVELLPGLEAEDILPGITGTTVWKNIVEQMWVSKGGNDDQPKEASLDQQRSAHEHMNQTQSHMQNGMLSHDMQHRGDSTVPAPIFKKMSIVSMGSPDIAASKFLPRTMPGQSPYTYQAMPIPAEMPRARAIGLNPDSDDTLCGFLTCRAADIS
jgi:hypothetical protein